MCGMLRIFFSSQPDPLLDPQPMVIVYERAGTGKRTVGGIVTGCSDIQNIPVHMEITGEIW